jgi:hypothetical protein
MGLNKSILFQGSLFLRSNYNFFGTMDSFLLSNLFQDSTSLVVLVFVQSVFFYFFNRQRCEKGILLNDFPSVQIQLSIHGTLS